MCVTFVPFHQEENLPNLAEILHIWKIQVHYTTWTPLPGGLRCEKTLGLELPGFRCQLDFWKDAQLLGSEIRPRGLRVNPGDFTIIPKWSPAENC